MKRRYEKPIVEIESYELDTSIASNCGIVVKMGPEYGSHSGCDDYYDISGESNSNPKMRSNYNVDFWENCDCYTSASGIFFTS